MCAIDHGGGEGEVVFACEGAGEYIGAGGSDSSSCGNVPPVVFFCVGTSPADVCGEEVGGCAPFPAVAALQEGCALEGYGGVGGREGVVIAVVGTFFFYGVFEQIGGGKACRTRKYDLFCALVVPYDERADESGDGSGEHKHIGGGFHSFPGLRLCGDGNGEQEAGKKYGGCVFHVF